MQMHVEIKKVILRLFLLTWLISMCASESCTHDSSCRLYAKCNLFKQCVCESGSSSYDGRGDLKRCDNPAQTAITVFSTAGTIIGVFIIIGVIACCIVRHRRLMSQGNPQTGYIQTAFVVDQVPMPPRTPQAVYPVQHQPTAPPDPGYNNAGYDSSQPPPYSAVECK